EERGPIKGFEPWAAVSMELNGKDKHEGQGYSGSFKRLAKADVAESPKLEMVFNLHLSIANYGGRWQCRLSGNFGVKVINELGLRARVSREDMQNGKL
ncbi:hypothetical protein KI387_011729, partial [Taxus chinensis]